MQRNKSFQNKPMLYLISTPIGNLGEISKRTIEILNSVDLVGAEDTRNSLNLLNYLNIKKPMLSVHEHNEKQGAEQIVNRIKNGSTVAYMSDAGYPGISDPGKIIVEECIRNGIPVAVVNGSSAFLTALVASGLETSHFYFHGFLSSKDSDAKKELEQLKEKHETLIFYESPHRIIRTIELLNSALGDRKVCLCRELTKINEEYIRGTLAELSKIDESTLKGEMVIIVEGNLSETIVNDSELIERYRQLLDKGILGKAAIEVVSEEYKINKNYIKSLVIKK